MTLYHHFKSKNDIITAVLQDRVTQRHAGIRKAMDGAVSPRKKILAAFDYLAKIINEPQFRGCALINTTVELANPEHPASILSMRHKSWMASQFENVARQIGRASGRESVCQYV